jgi:hypothetical protein
MAEELLLVPTHGKAHSMMLTRLPLSLSLLAAFCAPVAFGQSASCGEAPVEDALVCTCVPPSAVAGVGTESAAQESSLPAAKIALSIPAGTPLRIAVDQRVRIDHQGQVVRGKLVEAVYAFDQTVIPAGSIASGLVTGVDPVSAGKRVLAYSNGDFSPLRKYRVSFNSLSLPDGRQLAIKTTVSPGTAEVVRLVSNPDKETQKGPKERARQETQGRIQEAKQEVHDSWQKLQAPGKIHRLKQYLLAQSPYRRQYIEPGTRFVADLDEPLDFGDAARTGEQLAAVGSAPAPDSTVEARLVAEVSSATATRGTPVTAILTQPLYSPNHELVLAVNTRLIGQVLQARPARKLHHNGELRVVFERIETSDEALRALAQIRPVSPQEDVGGEQNSRQLLGSLESVEVDRRSNIKLDGEGGARATDDKTRYLSTGLALLVAAAAARPDAERGTVDTGGDPGVRTAAGGSGFRLVGAVVSLAAKSTPVSILLSSYGASASIYSNFLSRGRDVILPKDTPLEISFGAAHPTTKTP